MSKIYKVVNVPTEPIRHHLGNFGLVLIKEDLPQKICEAAFKVGLPYFEEVKALQIEEQIADSKNPEELKEELQNNEVVKPTKGKPSDNK